MSAKKRCFMCERVLGSTFVEAYGQMFCLTCVGRVTGLIRQHQIVETLKSVLRYVWGRGGGSDDAMFKIDGQIRAALTDIGVDPDHV